MLSRRMLQVGLGVILGLAASVLLLSLPAGPGGSSGPDGVDPHLLRPPLPLPERTAGLIDQAGEPAQVVPADDGPHLVFFGYTHCPDVCPITMGAIAEVRDRLARSDRTRPSVTFVTVDPARDTPERLGEYLGHFGADVRGITGTEDAVRAAAGAWGVYIGPTPGPDAAPEAADTSGAAAEPDAAGTEPGPHQGHEGYVVDHTGRTFVVRDGRIVASFAPGTGADAMTRTLVRVLPADR